MPEFEVANVYPYVQLLSSNVGQADKMQTMCHGDPKGANIMYDEEQGISFYDFQWFGKAPPSKEPENLQNEVWKFSKILL